VQIAYLGIIQAARDFDDTRGAFSTFAVFHARNTIANHRRISMRKKRDIRRAVNLTDEDRDPFASKADERDLGLDLEGRELCEVGLSAMNARERKLMRMRFVDDLTLKDAGKKLGNLTKERTRQIEVEALAKARKVINA
jgi:RNA polymerase sigma factor (sigma-70 family)